MRLSRVSLLSALLAAPVQAEPVTLLDVFSVDHLAGIGAQWAIAAARGVARITYTDLTVQPLAGRMALTGVEIAPYGQPRGIDCRIGLDRAMFATAPLGQVEYSALDVDITGLSLSQDCLHLADAGDLVEMGIDGLSFERAALSLRYDAPSGGLDAELTVLAGDLAELRATVAFDFFAVDLETEEPVADLAFAELEVVDRGVVALASPLLPPEVIGVDFLDQAFREAFPGSADPQPPVPWGGGNKSDADKRSEQHQPAPSAETTDLPRTARVDDLTYDAAVAVSGFLSAPDGTIALQLAPHQPVRLTEEMFEDPILFASALNPQFVSADWTDAPRISADMLAAVESRGATPEAAIETAEALLSGIGLPRDPARALAILDPLLAAGSERAIALTLDHLDMLAPETAYRLARNAAALGDRDAFAHLDALEHDIGFARAVEIQEEAAPARNTSDDFLAQAFAAQTGIDAPRRYTDAYFYGLLALAGGDSAAERILDEIEAMGDSLTGAERAAWDAKLATVRAEATAAWLGGE